MRPRFCRGDSVPPPAPLVGGLLVGGHRIFVYNPKNTLSTENVHFLIARGGCTGIGRKSSQRRLWTHRAGMHSNMRRPRRDIDGFSEDSPSCKL